MYRKILSLALSLACAVSASATILRVNNTPGSSAPYSDFTTAHAVAAPGDTIHIEGSNTDYGNLTIRKRLVVIGPGYFLSENPNTPVSLPATTGYIYLERENANDPFSGAAGSELIGLSVTRLSFHYIQVEVSNVLISKCVINAGVYIRSFDVSGVQVLQNFLRNKGLDFLVNNPGFNNFTFANNIVVGQFRIPANSTGGIFHNVFDGNVFEVENFVGEVRSNILVTINANASFSLSTSGTGQVSHNTADNGQFGTDNGNNVASRNSLFVGPDGNSRDGQYQLLPTATAALNNAHDGTDRGAFGGSRPYSLSGQSLPAIISIVVPPIGTPSVPFTVTIRAISGN